MLIEILQSFLPWILFFILSGHQLNTAIIAAVLTSIIFEIKNLKEGFILSWASLMFFTFMALAVVLFRNQLVTKYLWVFSNGALASIAWISIIFRKPFTIQYAKKRVAKDKWQHPLFLRINYLLTATWGIIFSIGIGLHVIQMYYPDFNGWKFEVLSFLPSALGIWFSSWFPNWYREIYLRR